MPDQEALDLESEPLRDEISEDSEEESQEAVESQEAEAEETEESKQETEDGDDAAAEPKKKDRVQKRIDRLTADKRAAERRIQELESRLVETIKPASPPDTSPLKEADFESYEDFLVAKATQEAEKKVTARLQEEQQKRQTEQQRQRQSEMAASFQARADGAREKYEDFDDVAFDPSTPVTDVMMQAILESEIGPEIAYHLGSNHQEARRISSLSPVGQARELGKIEASLTLEAPKRQTNAPDPPNKVRANARAARDPSKMSQAEYEAFRSKSNTSTP